ncbi:hypothetical protein jhhlp_001659 [Lomentospora prolificans]|uniref:SET domain-containing protein n=1 Tax=Lomentospora prolificans TaxID=41688 RepID=A0A2N3NIS5_9PEZI|nr:hypothetical protein jhhlp_001659 [Lomentospora prolificans]
MRLQNPLASPGGIGIVSLTSLCLALASTSSAGASFTIKTSDICPKKDTSALLSPPASHSACPPLVDVDATVDPHLPWSQPFRCTERRKPEPYCVFAASHIGQLGVSILTTPRIASNLAPVIHSLYDSLFPAAPLVRKPRLHPPPGRLARIEGKGIGAVATQHIAAGETFIVDYAALVLHADYPRVTREDERLALLDYAVDRLVGPGPSAVRALSRSGLSKHLLEDVVQTNVFTREYEGENHHVLYPIVSRINHSCKPNSFLRYSTHGLTVGIAAFHDIQPGEEITISYISPVDTTENRRHRLQSHWGFTCTCPLCTSHTTDSDTARTKLRYIRAAANKAISVRDLDRAVSYLEELVRVIREEDMPSLLADPYEALAQVLWVRGEKEEATRYAGLLVDVEDEYGRLEVRDRETALEKVLRGLGPLGGEKK